MTPTTLIERHADHRMVTSQRVDQKVHAIFRDKLHLDIDEDTDIMAAGVLDSMAFVQLIVELEEAFDLSVDVATMSLEDFRTMRRITRYIESRLDDR